MSGEYYSIVQTPLQVASLATTYPLIAYKFDASNRVPVHIGALSYMRERNRTHAYNLIIDEFEKSGISKAALAARLGKASETITRWLGTPSNWTLDTVSDLLFAISGAELNYNVTYTNSGHDNEEAVKPNLNPSTTLEAVPYKVGQSNVYTIFSALPFASISVPLTTTLELTHAR